ncbi:hypothetical protein NGUA41_02141 [Salmonella enterica]|nr:hypothetical protein NGUA40_04605 [Salmonella enterica]GAS77282.1 hypothetical protein NGUA41_02141 [Salmonella enterica]
MLRKFEHWLINNASYNFSHNTNTLSESMVIDIENEKYIARFTVWDDLSCMSEVMDADTGDYKMNRRTEFSTFDKLLDTFNMFLKKY